MIRVWLLVVAFMLIVTGIWIASVRADEPVSISLEASQDSKDWVPISCRHRFCDVSGWKFVRTRTHVGLMNTHPPDCLVKMEVVLRLLDPYMQDVFLLPPPKLRMPLERYAHYEQDYWNARTRWVEVSRECGIEP